MTELCKDSYQRGYDQAFADMYHASGDEDHAEKCGECRACGVVHQVVEDTVHQIAAFMTEAEFYVFSAIVANVKERREALRTTKRNKHSRGV